jgi:hypothetical protein
MGNTGKQCRKEFNNSRTRDAGWHQQKGHEARQQIKVATTGTGSAHCSWYSTNTCFAHEAHPCWKEYVIASDANSSLCSLPLLCSDTNPQPHIPTVRPINRPLSPHPTLLLCYIVTHTTLNGQCLSQALLAYLVCPLVCPTLVSGPSGCQTLQKPCIHSYCCGIPNMSTHEAQLPNTTQTPGQHQSCTLTQCALPGGSKHVAAPVNQPIPPVAQATTGQALFNT